MAGRGGCGTPFGWHLAARSAGCFGFAQANRPCRREAMWENGKPAFGFPLFQHASPALWECGNLVRIWRDFQGAVGRGSLGLALHTFHCRRRREKALFRAVRGGVGGRQRELPSAETRYVLYISF